MSVIPLNSYVQIVTDLGFPTPGFMQAWEMNRDLITQLDGDDFNVVGDLTVGGSIDIEGPIRVASENENAWVRLTESNLTPASRDMLTMINNGRPNILFANTAKDAEWEIGTGTSLTMKYGVVGSDSAAKATVFTVASTGKIIVPNDIKAEADVLITGEIVFEGATSGVNYTDLDDVDASYTGQAGQAVVVNATEDGLEFGSAGGGASAFTDLSDAPSSYTGAGGQIPVVNSGETALAFEDTILSQTVSAQFTKIGDATSWTSHGTVNPRTSSQCVTVEDDDIGYLGVQYDATATGVVKLRSPTKNPVAGADFDYVWRIDTVSLNARAGVFLEDTGTGETIAFVRLSANNLFYQYYTGTTFSSEALLFTDRDARYMRVVRVGTVLTFYTSHDGLLWAYTGTLAVGTGGAFLSDVDQVGVWISATSASDQGYFILWGMDDTGPQVPASIVTGTGSIPTSTLPTVLIDDATITNNNFADGTLSGWTITYEGTGTVAATSGAGVSGIPAHPTETYHIGKQSGSAALKTWNFSQSIALDSGCMAVSWIMDLADAFNDDRADVSIEMYNASSTLISHLGGTESFETDAADTWETRQTRWYPVDDSVASVTVNVRCVVVGGSQAIQGFTNFFLKQQRLT